MTTNTIYGLKNQDVDDINKTTSVGNFSIRTNVEKAMTLLRFLSCLVACVMLLCVRAVFAQTPKEILDVRDAPTAAVFALMYQSVYVSRHFRPFVTLRLTHKEISISLPDDFPYGYGPLPILGWLKAIEKALKTKLLVEFEREANCHYISQINGIANAGSDGYGDNFQQSLYENHWHRLPDGKADRPDAPAPETPLSRYRFAGVHWKQDSPYAKALLVVRTEAGDAYVRVVREKEYIMPDLTVEKIEPSRIFLRRVSNGERIQLQLRGNRKPL